jgi:aspartate aminotransferase-like enzyme
VSLCAFSPDAWTAVETHPTPRPHWCYDAIRAQRFWGHQQYHYTAPTPGILALHEALRLVVEETLERRFHRHTVYSRAMQAGLEAMGLQLFVSSDVRLDSVIAVRLPAGVDSARVRHHMANAYFVEISGRSAFRLFASARWVSSAARTACGEHSWPWVTVSCAKVPRLT